MEKNGRSDRLPYVKRIESRISVSVLRSRDAGTRGCQPVSGEYSAWSKSVCGWPRSRTHSHCAVRQRGRTRQFAVEMRSKPTLVSKNKAVKKI